MRLRIRPAALSDLPVLADAEQAVFSDAWSDEALRAALVSPIVRALIAEDATNPDSPIFAGYFIGTLLPPEGEVLRIAVPHGQRNRGIGRALLAAFADGADAPERVFLEVRSQNAPALALYRAFGFSEVGRRKNYYKNPKDDAIVMERSHHAKEPSA